MELRVYLIVSAIIFLPCLEILGTDKVHFGKHLQNSNDGSTYFYTFEWIVMVSKAVCVEACKSTKACEYINYEVRAHNCALIRRNNLQNDYIVAVVVRRPGYIFGNKSEWTTAELAECDGCHNSGKCSDEHSECRNSGCEMPRSEGFRGNMYGSKVLKNCTAVTQQMTFKHMLLESNCAENGSWIDPTDCFVYWNGSYYSSPTVRMSWYDARANCENMAGHIVDIGSAEEAVFVRSLTHYGWLWTDGNDIEEEGNFVWSDGSVVSEGYSNWGNEQPDNENGVEDCITINGKEKINDLRCVKLHKSVCEIPTE